MKKESAKTKQIKALIAASGSGFMSMTFVKKDGSQREIVFNPKARKGLVGDSASDSAKMAVKTRAENNPNLINVLDSQLAKDGAKYAWRSINSDTVKRVVSGKTIIEFKE